MRVGMDSESSSASDSDSPPAAHLRRRLPPLAVAPVAVAPRPSTSSARVDHAVGPRPSTATAADTTARRRKVLTRSGYSYENLDAATFLATPWVPPTLEKVGAGLVAHARAPP